MKKKILVVDDEQDVLKALKIRLKANGYHVLLASDSVEAFSMANEERPDLVILDILLPGGGGFVVAERLKQSPTTHHIPIIFLTGISGGEEKAYRLGASGYIMKPYDSEKLLETIHDALELSGKPEGELRSEMRM
jgi:CheY-like chemotaxis protein